MALYLDQILLVRDRMMENAPTDPEQFRNVLIAEFPERTELREQILNLAYGRPLSRTPPSLLSLANQTDGDLNLPVPVVATAVRTESLQDLLPLFDFPVEEDPIRLVRRAMAALDNLRELIPGPANLNDLSQALPVPGQFKAHLPRLLTYLNELLAKTEVDEENLDRIQTSVNVLSEKVNARLGAVGTAAVTAPANDAARSARRLEEAQMIQTSLAHTVQILEQRTLRQVEYTGTVAQLQALLRAMQTQQALGNQTLSIEAEFTDVVRSITKAGGNFEDLQE